MIDKIKKRMKTLRVTQAQLAKLTGISRRTLIRKLQGQTELTLVEAEKIGKVLNIQIIYY